MILLAAAAQIAWPQADFHKIKTEYQAVTADLRTHTKWDGFPDNDSTWIPLVNRQWNLAAEWVAACLNNHEQASLDDVKAALADLGDEKPRALRLDSSSFLVVSPGMYGNVFVVSNARGRYRVAWTTASRQEFVPSNDHQQDDLIAAWIAQPKGDNWTTAGPLMPTIAKLPAKDLFYIDAAYDQPAGGSGVAQISVWRWDGTEAHPLLAQSYGLMFDQKVGTRVENGVLKVQEKREYRSFNACGGCEGRQVDLIFQITAHGIQPAGETVVTPELDALDEFYHRLLHGEDAKDIASRSAIEFASSALTDVSTEISSAGMMGEWSIKREGAKEIVCFSADEAGSSLFTLERSKDGFFIEAIEPAHDLCKPDQKP